MAELQGLGIDLTVAVILAVAGALPAWIYYFWKRSHSLPLTILFSVAATVVNLPVVLALNLAIKDFHGTVHLTLIVTILMINYLLVIRAGRRVLLKRDLE